MRHGGVRQRLARHAAQSTDAVTPLEAESELALLLLRRWAWGHLSLPQLQSTAAAAERDFAAAGAEAPAALAMMAALGTRGEHPNNMLFPSTEATFSTLVCFTRTAPGVLI